MKAITDMSAEELGGLICQKLHNAGITVTDRLAAFFHWNDRQSLEQALLVARAQKVDMKDIRRWSKSERNEPKFRVFQKRLKIPARGDQE